MLVIVSDLHLTDGTASPTLQPAALELLTERIRDLAQRASWRADGVYRPLAHVDLVLLGDTLDCVDSARWLKSETRPWHDPHSPATVEVVCGIVDDILRHNSRSLSALRALAAEGSVRLPTHSGYPGRAVEEQPVAVRIHYMVGNRDWLLHSPGADYDLLRRKIAHHLGLAAPANNAWPHDPSESGELLEVLRRHRVVARHGDVFDPLSFSSHRDESSIGDALLIDLLGRFQLALVHELAGEVPEAAVAGLENMHHVRPLTAVPQWLASMVARWCPAPALAAKMESLWNDLSDRLLDMPAVRDMASHNHLPIDDLRSALTLRTGPAADRNAALVACRRLESRQGNYARHALAEADFRNRRARYIVYGHTHRAETVPLEASHADAFVLNQLYFNAGTWRRVLHPTVHADGPTEFMPIEHFTCLAFYQGCERGGRPFETWSGTLSVPGGDGTVRRVDEPRQTVASARTAPAAGSARPPHFTMPAASRSAAQAQP